MTIKQSLKVINLNTYGELLWTHLNTKVIMHNRALLRACLHGGGGAQPRSHGAFSWLWRWGQSQGKEPWGRGWANPR